MSEMNFDRMPPYNEQAEQSILGAMLLDKQAVSDAAELLVGDDFYMPAHKELFLAMMELYRSGHPVDLVTLVNELERRGSLEAVGGLDYVTLLTQQLPTLGHAQNYMEIVRDKGTLRRLISYGNGVVKKSYEASQETREIISESESELFSIATKKDTSSLEPIKDVLLDTYEHIETVAQNKGEVMGLPTGFASLDTLTTGLHPSELILIAARPSMGKTSFALNIAQHVAMKQNGAVAMFSLEMNKEQLANRLLCSEAMVDMQKVRNGNLTDHDWTELAKAMGRLGAAPIFIDDTPGISTMEMRSKCMRLSINQNGLALVVVDYLQLMTSGRRIENRQAEVSEISRALKVMSRELNVPVIALSQLSRLPTAGTITGPACPIFASPAPSSRTPISSCFCTGTRCTIRKPRWETRRRSLWPNSATAPSASSRCPGWANTPGSWTWPGPRCFP